MERVDIWYITDNDEGKSRAEFIKELGLSIYLLDEKEFLDLKLIPGTVNIFILDFLEKKIDGIMSLVRENHKVQSHLKFVLLKKRQIKKAINISMNLLHVEFISRPVNKREFILLLEKSLVVERYREMMKHISKGAESRIETFESLMSINRKDLFEDDQSKEVFEKILEHERHLLLEQRKLNDAVKNFTYMRQKELFDMKDRIRAEEMLDDLRRQELLDAESVIKAQESLINYSSQELYSANQIIEAREKAAELSRMEIMKLNECLESEKAKNDELVKEIRKLKSERRKTE